MFGCVILFAILNTSFVKASNFDMSLNYLQNYGYLHHNSNELSSISNTSNIYLQSLAHFLNNYQIFKPNAELTEDCVKLMRSSRCGVADEVSLKIYMFRWETFNVTWSLHHSVGSFYTKLVKRAFNAWNEATNLNFFRDNIHPNILITLNSTFENNVLAYTFYLDLDQDPVEIHMNKHVHWDFTIA